jgi:glucose/arabinose dehydrogenase
LILRGIRLAACTAAAMGTFGAVATAAGPPPPTSTNGNAVETVVGSGLGTPTSFAFAGGKVFEGDGGVQDQTTGKTTAPGGVFLLANGAATRLAGSPPFVAGLAWRKGTLYVSAIGQSGPQLLAWSGWNGTTFTKQKVFYTPPKKFTGFNGLGFGADGRLYVGVMLSSTGDHGPPTTPFAYDMLSFNVKGKGKGPKIVAKGMRQPWQMVFPRHSSSPYVSDLGQDKGAKNPPDFILRVHQGDNFGFPKCNWTNAKACKQFAKPFKLFSPHTDVMGLGIIGKTLYMSEFLGDHGKAGLVQSMPVKGGKPKTLLQGFVAPVVGLGVNKGWVYVGELTGQVFRVKAG